VQTNDVQVFKAISKDDLGALNDLGAAVRTADQPVVMFTGEWQFGTSETFEAHTGVKAIRFPLEQRFIFDPEEVQTFFDQMVQRGYDLFVWVDATTSSEALDWLARYQTATVYTHDFSFQPGVRVTQLLSQ
jgi:hypothetical protein